MEHPLYFFFPQFNKHWCDCWLFTQTCSGSLPLTCNKALLDLDWGCVTWDQGKFGSSGHYTLYHHDLNGHLQNNQARSPPHPKELGPEAPASASLGYYLKSPLNSVSSLNYKSQRRWRQSWLNIEIPTCLRKNVSRPLIPIYPLDNLNSSCPITFSRMGFTRNFHSVSKYKECSIFAHLKVVSELLISQFSSSKGIRHETKRKADKGLKVPSEWGRQWACWSSQGSDPMGSPCEWEEGVLQQKDLSCLTNAGWGCGQIMSYLGDSGLEVGPLLSALAGPLVLMRFKWYCGIQKPWNEDSLKNWKRNSDVL